MDRTTLHSSIDEAVFNIVNYKSKPQSRTNGGPSSECSSSREDKDPKSQSSSQHGSASPSASNDYVGPPGPSVDEQTQPESQLPVVRTSHQPTQKAPYFKIIPDEAPSTPFAFGKYQPRAINIKPTRGSAATVCVVNTVDSQMTCSDSAKSSGDDAATSEGQEYMPKTKFKQQETRVDCTKPTLTKSIGLPESPHSLRYATRALTPHEHNHGYDTAGVEKESSPKRLQEAFVSPNSPSVEERSCSNTPTLQHVLETTKHNQDFPTEQTSDPKADDGHDEDTEMMDDRTLINPEDHSRTNTQRNRSAPSSPSERSTAKLQNIEKAVQSLERLRSKSISPSGITDARGEKDSGIGPEELLRKTVNMYCQHQEKEKAQVKAREQSRDRDIQDLQTISQALHEQLQETEARVAGQEQELTKYRQVVPQCKDRLKKLGDFLRGLSNDHTRLREIGDTIGTEQRNLWAQKDSVDKMLKDTVHAMEDERGQYQERVLALQHTAKMLEQALNTSSLNLRNETSRLQAEQGRNATLHERLVKSASQYEELTAKFAQQESGLSSRIADLRGLIQAEVCNSQPIDHDHLNEKLDECLRLLIEKPGSNTEISNLVQKFDASSEACTASISQLISACGKSAEATTQLVNRLETRLEGKFEKMIAVVEAGHPLREQIMDLREMRATIAEQLKAAEALLVESRLKVTASEKNEQVYLLKMSSLETEISTLRNQPRESPLSALRVHDAEKQSAEYKEQLSICQSQLEIMNTDVAAKCQEVSDLHSLLESTKADLAEQKAKAETTISEKEAIQRLAVQSEERIRAELSQTCTNQIAMNSHKSMNEIQGLRHQLKITEQELQAERDKESSINELQGQLNTSRDLISQSERDLNEAHEKRIETEQELEKAQDELRAMRGSQKQDEKVVNDLRLQLDDVKALNARLSAEIFESGKRLQESKQLLNGANVELKLKEAHIQDLTQKSLGASKAESALSSGKSLPLVDGGSLIAGAVIIEDSQDKAPRQKRGIIKQTKVVEDSQFRAAKYHPAILKATAVQEESQKTNRQPQSDMSKTTPIVEETQELDTNNYRQSRSSSDELNRETAPSFTQERQDRSLSPFTDTGLTSSPVVDGGVMFPPSPRVGKLRNSPVKETPRVSRFAPHSSTDYHKVPTQSTFWSYNTLTTSTKSRSVTASLFGGSPSTSSYPAINLASRSRSTGHPSPKPSGTTQSDSQSSQHTSQSPKKGVLKRTRPSATAGVSDTESHHKRQRLSSEAEKLGLGPTQVSPVKQAGSSRRKSTLRHSQPRDDKFSRRFSQELKKER